MKITTWNVNGMRAMLRKGLWNLLAELDSDVLCFQEVKARPEQIPDGERCPAGYLECWNPAEKAGYSGVAAFARIPPLDYRAGLGIEQFDREGRVLRLRYPGFWLYNVYFPSGQRGLDRVSFKLDFYSALLEEVKARHAQGEAVIITGDFNTAHREIDLANPKKNAKTSGFLPEERAWVDTYLAHHLIDAYRALYPDKVGYTWWTYTSFARERNVGWRLDYFLVSADLMPRVSDVEINHGIPGSDHCPVSLTIADCA
jgi:exodeoxyribonuclease-3